MLAPVSSGAFTMLVPPADDVWKRSVLPTVNDMVWSSAKRAGMLVLVVARVTSWAGDTLTRLAFVLGCASVR